MAIANFKPTKNIDLKPNIPEQIEAPEKSTMTALMNESKIKSLSKYVEGYPWTIEAWYGQILNTNTTIKHFDPSLDDLSQSYFEIKDMVLQVKSPLSYSYNQEDAVSSLNGASIFPLGIIPNAGDLFLATLDDGELAIFVVYAVERLTHRKSSLYQIDYKLYAYTSQNEDFLPKLKARVNDSYYFNKDTNYFNRDVLIRPSVKRAMDGLRAFLKESTSYYNNTFIQRDMSSIGLPGTKYSIYDPLLYEFISKTTPLPAINVGNVRHGIVKHDLKRNSILDCLTTRTIPHPAVVETKYGFINSRAFLTNARINLAHMTKVDYILYPIDPNDKHITKDKRHEHTLSEVEFLTDDNYGPYNEAEGYYEIFNPNVDTTTHSEQVTAIKLLPELFEDDIYIVSPNFYDYVKDKTNIENISYLELIIYKFLDRKAIPREDIYMAVETYKDWSLLHQFYLLPVMWLIARDAIGG